MDSNLKETYDSCKKIDEVSNKRNIDPRVIKAYLNLYSFLYDKINDVSVIPKLSDKDLIEIWISNRNWLMIPPKDCSNREEAKSSPYPNIWINVDKNLESMSAGLHWAQIKSVYNFLTILDTLNSKSREKLQITFKSLNKDYRIKTQLKTHKKGLAPTAPSDFEDDRRWRLKDFNVTIVDEILNSVEKIREKGHILKEREEVEWGVPTIMIEYEKIKCNEYEALLDVIMDYIKIIKVCHETLTIAQIKKIKKNMEKDFDYPCLKKDYERLKFLLNVKVITEDHFKVKIDELNQKIREYNATFNKNLDFFNKTD